MRPLTAALLIAGSFFVLAMLYLATSDELARQLTSSVAEYHQVQSLKGIAFMVVASLGIFGLSHHLLQRIEQQVVDNQAGRETLLLMERRVLAGTLAASIIHDVKNLVGAIRANLHFIQRTSPLDGEADEALTDSVDAAEQLLALNDRLSRAAKRQLDEERVEVDLAELVAQAVSLIEMHAALTECSVHIDAPEHLPAKVYPNLVTHAVINLVLNAAAAAADAEAGLVCVSLAAEADHVHITVEDNGVGIPADQREAVLEPFHSATEGGTGLGLFSVSYCATRHSGRLAIEDSELGGALIRLELHAHHT